jgi:DNA repair protein RecO (recombination protein O)
VVLRAHKLGEADRILTLLTAEHGKVRAVAKGIRRTSSKFGGRLEPSSQVDLQLATGRSLDTITQAETINAFSQALGEDFEKYQAGSAMLEAADRLVPEEGVPARSQYRLLVGALYALAHGAHGVNLVRDSHLLRAMAIAGYTPVLDGCARCGKPGPWQWFSVQLGGVACDDCHPPGSVRLDPEVLSLLRALLAGDWEATREVPPEVQAEASGVVAAFVNWHLEQSIRSLN